MSLTRRCSIFVEVDNDYGTPCGIMEWFDAGTVT